MGIQSCSIRLSGCSREQERITARFDSELARVRAAHPQGLGPPLRAVAEIARAYAELDPTADDALGRRRRVANARRLAALAACTAGAVHGAFGDRPDFEEALGRVVADVRARARRPTLACGPAFSEVARAALALPAFSEDDDWQLSAIAFADEALLRAFYDACVMLVGGALQVVEAG